ncbi:PREDICTED: putative nuclease HARBI1 [Priapulus caudatus]|uniref:Nuclease HARBI1 n=1 Tax=Priapulus caudatus TaxID=37621 RepID=A0ABM1E9D0_PRICU|nr:PREDICTED: putative nuclease HARBI1 [Priapulus caudatus]
MQEEVCEEKESLETERIHQGSVNKLKLDFYNVAGFSNNFVNIVARWPGSSHDSFVFQNSHIGNTFATGNIDGWLLGDSGYPLRPYLMTPILNPNTESERYKRECAFGVWKLRFRCLHLSTGGALRYTPDRACRIIMATAVLHNIAVREKIPLLPDENEAEFGGDDINVGERPNDNADGRRVREQLIQQRFAM